MSDTMTDHVAYLGYLGGFPGLLFRPRGFGQYIPTEWTIGVGEPVNAILSAKSDPQILIDQETNGGLRNYFLCVLSPRTSRSRFVEADRRYLFGRLRSFQFGAECLGQHAGSHQLIDLGDGNGPSTSSYFIRPAAPDLRPRFKRTKPR